MAGLPFALSTADAEQFLTNVPQAANDIESHHMQASGTPSEQWNQNGNIPQNGRAYAWGARWILVYLDDSYIWHFIDVSAMPSVQTLVASTNAAQYFSPPGNVYADIVSGMGGSTVASIASIPTAIETGVSSFMANLQAEVNGLFTGGQTIITTSEYVVLAIVLAGLVVIGVAVWRVKSFKIPGLGITGK